jgi:hypothetical protein
MSIVAERHDLIKSFDTLVPVAPQVAPETAHPHHMPATDVVEIVCDSLEAPDFRNQQGVHLVATAFQFVDLPRFVIAKQRQIL